MEKNFSYEEITDDLIVTNRQENETVKTNFEVGDIIFSLTGKGKIVAIEIRGFSSFLESCNIDPEIIKNIQNIQLNILPKKETIFILLKIELLQENIIVSKNIPLVLPLISQ